jgi:hypothetical protein
MKTLMMVAVAAIALAGCRAPLSKRLSDMPDPKVCHAFADFAYKGISWQVWQARREVELRKLQDNDECKGVFAARMAELAAKDGTRARSWEQAIQP